MQDEKEKVKVAQLWPVLCESMDCKLPGSSIHGILQARILVWVNNPFSSLSSWSTIWTGISCIEGGFFTSWVTMEAIQESWVQYQVRKIPWRRAWQPTPVFWPGRFHGQCNLAHTHTHTHTHFNQCLDEFISIKSHERKGNKIFNSGEISSKLHDKNLS